MAVTALLDVNVLLALAWPNHVHHASAREWFDANREEGWATCALTEAGFVRISCNPDVVQHEVTPLDAIGVLGRLTQNGAHTFWPLARSIVQLPEAVRARIQGYRQVTDAILLAAAIHHKGHLVTLDSAMRGLAGESQRDYVTIIPV